MTAPVEVIGVVGAGTMGAGITQLAAQTGARTLLYDADGEALERGLDDLRATLAKLADRGKITAGDAEAIGARIEPVTELDGLAPAGLVIEAAPERLELKVDLFCTLLDVVDGDCVLATNTSSLSVTEIAAATDAPDRVVGLHFFNPAPVMRLVEVVAGERSSPAALTTARAVGEAMGKRVIDAGDVAGFLVNRANRPFSLEALKLVEEGIATVEQVDRICRMGGGFRMGPFELMDLVGIDTNHAVAEAFQRQSYGEPRYRPSPLAARKVAAGTLGRKTGSGWYEYPAGPPPDPEPPAPGGGEGRVVEVTGDSVLARELRAAAQAAGFATQGGEPWLTVGCDRFETTSGPQMLLVEAGSLHGLMANCVGFHAVPPLDDCRLIELTTTAATEPIALERAREFVAATGRVDEHVGDAPGLVLGRILAQMMNEAAFLVDEGNGTPADVDAGMELGLNHPRGPFAWRDLSGIDWAITLNSLHEELGEPRYRSARSLRQANMLPSWT